MVSTLVSLVETSFSFPLLLLITPLSLLILKYKFSKYPPLPPGPTPWPIIGNLPLMGNNPHVVFAQLAKAHGPLISLRFGTQLVVVGSSPAAATAILKTHDRELSGRHVPFALFLSDPKLNRVPLAWTFECNEEWKSFRTLMKSELFTSKKIDNQSIIRENKVGEMVEYLVSKEGQKVEIREVLFVYVFNSLANIYCSKDLETFEFGGSDSNRRRASSLVRDMLELWAAPNISDMFPLLSVFDLQCLRRKSDQCVEKMREIWDSTIKERRERKGAGEHDDVCRDRDFLDVLLDSGFSDELISYIFVELLAAVSDGSTSTMEWAMAELIKNPNTMRKLQEELAQKIPESLIKESDLADLPYLHACIKETLRLHPPSPFLLPHRAIKDCQVMNYTVPKDSRVLVNAWAIGRDPTVWGEPLSFKPERFQNSDVDYKGKDFQFLPFGSGRRICAGLPVGVRLIQLALASLLYHFEWSLPDHNNITSPHEELDMDEKFGITLMKQQPLVLIPKLRKL